MRGSGPRPAADLTLVFTDVEGSTALLTSLGDAAYAEALGEHRRVIRAVFGAHGGREVDTQGDAFFWVFTDPADAVRAATKAQSELEPGPVRVRMGVHSGTVLATDEGYTGREVHRAARIAAAGHGDQVLVSAATRRLLAGQEGLDLQGLGEHRVRDFDEAIDLFQIGRSSFPPLRTISNTNLPNPASAFVGRAAERDAVIAMLRAGQRGGARIVTLTGPGGTGKTRLAIETAGELVSEFPGGVFWVPVATLREPSLVIEAVASSLGGDDAAEVIGDRHLLLVIDNLEQVIEAASDLAELVAACPNLQLLVTSREVMRVPGEAAYAVPPLSEPDAVELFRRLTRLPDDPASSATIRELCRRLDDMPLALEMAAARTGVMTPAQILDRLGRRLDLLKGGRGVDPRQQTLRATIEWSHDLLADHEKAVFAGLSVFRGGALLEAAEAVADADLDTLQSLVDKSLVGFADGRFTMLETIRAYARERLEQAGQRDEVRGRVAGWLLGYCAGVFGEVGEVDSHVLVERLRAEQDNMSVALEWADETRHDQTLLELVAVGGNQRVLHHDRERWGTLALERAHSPVSARIDVLAALSIEAAARHDFAASEARITEWVALAEREGDEYQVLKALSYRAVDAGEQGRYGEARSTNLMIRERASAAGFGALYGAATINLADAELHLGDLDAATACAVEALHLADAERDSRGRVLALDVAGCAALLAGDAARAVGHYRSALPLCVALADTQLACIVLSGAAGCLVALGEPSRAAALLGGVAASAADLPFIFEDELHERLREEAEAEARAALGEERFTREWQDGASMTLEELAALAGADLVS